MSGFPGHDIDRPDQSQHYAAAGTNAAASLQAGHPFSLLLAEDDRQRTAELDNLLDAVADTRTRFARATNPLRARLTLERLLIQVLDDPEATQLDPATLIRRIAARRGDETRVVLVIERAETLHPEVLRFFGQTAPLFPDGVPKLQLLFVGRPEFRGMLDNPDAGLDARTAQLEAYRPSEPAPVFAPPPEFSVATLPQRPLPFLDTSLRAQFLSVWQHGFFTQLAIILGTLGGTAAIAFTLFLVLTTNEPAAQVETGTALLEAPEPAEVETDPPALQPGPPPDAETAQLRREFEAYLTASGRDISKSTPAQRRTVFQEFLVWRARTTGARTGG